MNDISISRHHLSELLHAARQKLAKIKTPSSPGYRALARAIEKAEAAMEADRKKEEPA